MLERKGEADNPYQMIICSLIELVPKDHLVVKILKLIDFERFRPLLEQYYNRHRGRPSVDPVMIIKIVLLQHLFNISSMRQTIEEIKVNNAYRFFLGIGLSTPIPHHATVSYALVNRFPEHVFDDIFNIILEELIQRGYVDSKNIFIDSTHIQANASKYKYRKELKQEIIKGYRKRLFEEINTFRKNNNVEEIKEEKEVNMKETLVSTTDPDSGMDVKNNVALGFTFRVHTGCDRNNFIVGFKVKSGNTHDSVVFDEMYDGLHESIKKGAEVVVGDSAYGTPWISKRLSDDGKKLATPFKRTRAKAGNFKNSEYRYDKVRNVLICPNGKELAYRGINRDGYMRFVSQSSDCAICPFKYKCTDKSNKVVLKHIWHEYIEAMDEFRDTEEFRKVYRKRATTIERIFADAKEKYGMRRTLFRGLDRVKASIALKYTAMNIKKLVLLAC